MHSPTLAWLSEEQWLPLATAHAERSKRFGEPFTARRMNREKHPIEDFLFTYYTQKPGQLYRWHPGPGVVLGGEQARERAEWKFYREVLDEDTGERGYTVDVEAFAAARLEAIRFARIILAGTVQRPGNFACFGLHEWAMAYKSEQNGIRHEYLPLRLGAEGTDAVVEEHKIRCTHFDAFRFYTPEAVPLNELRPTRETQRNLEQPGCLHANMDLYKWAYKLTPAVPSELVMDCFELAWDIRTMDMQASPYDLLEWGHEPIRIETPAGKAEYVRRQKDFADRAQELRRQVAGPCPGTAPGTDLVHGAQRPGCPDGERETRMSPRMRFPVVATLFAALVLLAGCGGNDGRPRPVVHSAATQTSAPPTGQVATVDLDIVIRADGKTESADYSLQCAGATALETSKHPRAAEACALLAKHPQILDPGAGQPDVHRAVRRPGHRKRHRNR